MRLRNLLRLAAGYLYYGRQGKQTPQETQYIYDGELRFTHLMESIINRATDQMLDIIWIVKKKQMWIVTELHILGVRKFKLVLL